ncbi:MAG: hypothetical protein IIW83_01890, partial [Clostridia bacterium]|nr:hypothetical protein [Clostridia bacterium]
SASKNSVDIRLTSNGEKKFLVYGADTAEPQVLTYTVEGLQASLDDELKNCDETVEKCTNSINGCEMLLAKRREKFDAIKENIDKLTLDESEKRRRAQIIEDLEKNMEGFAHSVKTVMNCSKRNELRGIHGTVYQLFKVDNKHAVAIEAALGNALQNIVVSSEEDAKTAIN